MRSRIPCSLAATHLFFPWHIHSSANCFLSWMLRDSPSPVVPFTVSTQHTCWGLAYMHWFYWRQELILFILNRKIFPPTHFKIAVVHTSICLCWKPGCFRIGNFGREEAEPAAETEKLPSQHLLPTRHYLLLPAVSQAGIPLIKGCPPSQAKWLSLLHPKEAALHEIRCHGCEWNHMLYLG